MFETNYTVKLCELLNNEETKKLIDKALSTYPLYEKKSKEEYIPSYIPTREELNKKILNYYKYREIGLPTVGLFLDELEIAMNEIMPYYNLLFMSADQDYNPIYNVDYKRELTTNKDGTSNTELSGNESVNNTSNSSSTGTTNSEVISNTTTEGTDKTNTATDVENNNKFVKSTTPQGALNVDVLNIDSVNYGDEVTFNRDKNTDEVNTNGESKTTSEGTTTNQGTTTGSNETTSNTTGENSATSRGTTSESETSLERTVGNYGQVSAQNLILTYRKTITNIVQQIINDNRIAELFMQIY